MVDLVAGSVEVIVVDVELCGGVSCACGLEGDVDEGLAENFVENRLPEVAAVVEDLVDNVLDIVRGVCVGDEERGNIPKRISFPYNGPPGW